MGNQMAEVTTQSFEKDVLKSSTPVLVDFWAEWCGPCRMLSPIVEQLAGEYSGKLRVVMLDADASPDVVMSYGVMGLPTLILFKNGEPVARITGYQPKDRIVKQIQPHLN
ncbi:MAG: thioredoxin [Anaerolineae bacterium]